MLNFKTFSLFTVLLSTVFLFLFFSCFVYAQSSDSFHNVITLQSDYSSIHTPLSDYSSIITPRSDYSSIYTPNSNQFNIYTLNQDLIEFHNPSLYSSIHLSENNNSGSLLIVKDNNRNVLQVINLNNDTNNKQKSS